MSTPYAAAAAQAASLPAADDLSAIATANATAERDCRMGATVPVVVLQEPLGTEPLRLWVQGWIVVDEIDRYRYDRALGQKPFPKSQGPRELPYRPLQHRPGSEYLGRDRIGIAIVVIARESCPQATLDQRVPSEALHGPSQCAGGRLLPGDEQS